jgi:hypothetical protein
MTAPGPLSGYRVIEAARFVTEDPEGGIGPAAGTNAAAMRQSILP